MPTERCSEKNIKNKKRSKGITNFYMFMRNWWNLSEQSSAALLRSGMCGITAYYAAAAAYPRQLRCRCSGLRTTAFDAVAADFVTRQRCEAAVELRNTAFHAAAADFVAAPRHSMSSDFVAARRHSMPLLLGAAARTSLLHDGILCRGTSYDGIECRRSRLRTTASYAVAADFVRRHRMPSQQTS
jgi:hypothetical protein